MDIIEAVEKKEKKDKKIVYSFTLENEGYEAHYDYGKKPGLTFLHNGTQVGVVEKAGNKVSFRVNENKPVNITAWIEGGVSSWLFGKTQGGVGIEVDGKPVQHTLTDPETHIKAGKVGLCILVFIFAFKTVVNIATAGVIVGMIYLIPLLILLAALLRYKKWLSFALYAGVILSILEMIDYLLGIPSILQARSSLPTLVIWIGLRISAFANLFDALKWMRKGKAKTP